MNEVATESPIRAFVALPVPLTLKRELELYQGSLLRNPRQLKIVKPANFHITLQFLGNITAGQQEVLEAGLAEIAGLNSPFEIEIGGVSSFPGAITIPVIGGRNEIVALGLQVRTISEAAGIAPDRKPLVPHITLARLRDRATKPEDFFDEEAAEEAYRWTVRSLVLYRSQTEPEGPLYTELARLPLAGEPVTV